MIYDYIIKLIQENYPSVPVGSNSLINDLLINPHIEILKPFIQLANTIDSKQLFSNYDYISEEEIDAIGSGNYFIDRDSGTKASGYVYLEFQNIPTSTGIYIAAGTSVGKNTTYKYTVTSNTTVTSADLALYYNSTRLVYSVPVLVEADAVGTAYNAEIGEINALYSTLQYSTGVVSNLVAFTNGRDDETNEEYYDRIKNVYLSRNLGTAPGYESSILENFEDVDDLVVIGYGDALMQRDVISTLDGDIHIGGKVDVYIKGSNLSTYTKNFLLYSTRYYFKNTPIVESSVTATNLSTNLPASVTVGYINLAEKGTALEESYIDVTGATIGDEISVAYTYVDTAGAEILSVEYFYYNARKTKLDDKPMYEISNILNVSQIGQTKNDGTLVTESEAAIPSTEYTISYVDSDSAGTTLEECIVGFTNPANDRTILQLGGTPFPYYTDGDEIEITYTCNDLITDIQNYYNEEDQRVICTDILIKPANKSYVYIGINIKPNAGYTIGTTEKALIISTISSYVNTVKFVGSLNTTELISKIYADTSITRFLNYIQLPITIYNLPVVEPVFATARPEIVEVEVTHAASASGNITLTLGGTATTIAVDSGDTTDQVANKIQSDVDSLDNYTASVADSTVTITSTTNIDEDDATFNGGTTGVTADTTVIQQGLDTINKSTLTFTDTYYPVLQICTITAI